FQGFKPGLQFAVTLRLNELRDELILPPRLVDGDTAVDLNLEPVGEAERTFRGGSFEKDAGELGEGILEGEIVVPRSRKPVIADFPLDPDPAELLFETLADARGDSRDGMDLFAHGVISPASSGL